MQIYLTFDSYWKVCALKYSRNPHKRTYISRRQPVQALICCLPNSFIKDGRSLISIKTCKLVLHSLLSSILLIELFCQNCILNFSHNVLILWVLLCGFLVYHTPVHNWCSVCIIFYRFLPSNDYIDILAILDSVFSNINADHFSWSLKKLY